MNTIRFFILTLCFGFAFATFNAKAQTFNWGADVKASQEKWTVLKDAIFLKQYKNGIEPLEWLITNTPDLNPDLYKKGAELYDELIKVETDPQLKSQYEDKSMEMYDLRAKQYSSDLANILNRKGLRALTYWQDRPEKFSEMFALYQKIVEMNGDATAATNVNNLMVLACSEKNAGKINDEQMQEIYDKTSNIINNNLAKNDQTLETWKATKTFVDNKAQECIKIDCDFVKTTMYPKYKANPNDLELLKKMYNALTSGKCIEMPEFIEITEALVSKEPNFKRYNVLALAYKAKGDNTLYYQNLEKAMQYAENNTQKAEILLILAQAGINTKSNALQAVSLDGSKAFQAYSLIGNLYMRTSCGGDNPVVRKANYIAAYNMYAKAGNSQGMAAAQQGFPTREEIFTYGMGGQTVALPCLGESVVIPN
ncbi:MAG: hypothetical protein EAZ55_14110 [Cytophagales bacterium]|nr:MAG: hypothetical protein EAZ55_14110 [Cytophagales bacterium]